jgi:CxxC motif-containing protein (DUF1111 family)
VPALKTTPLSVDALTAGKAAFTRAGCASCHAGAQLAGGLAEVGTGGTFKTPTLLGLNARAPLMHSGCAATLTDRFTSASCGGTRHGDFALLSATEQAALLTYLRSL